MKLLDLVVSIESLVSFLWTTLYKVEFSNVKETESLLFSWRSKKSLNVKVTLVVFSIKGLVEFEEFFDFPLKLKVEVIFVFDYLVNLYDDGILTL